MAYYIPKNTITDSSSRTKLKHLFSAIFIGLLVIGSALYIFRLEASDFQQINAENVERLHTAIQAEKYREIFLHNDRYLIIENDEAELTAMFKQAHFFLTQKPQIICSPPRFEDSLNRVCQRFGKPFAFSNFCMLRTANGASAIEYFVWKNSGGDLKLIYYEFSVR